MTNRADFWDGKSLGSEVAANYQDCECVEIVGQEPGYVNLERWVWSDGTVAYVALMPPTNVYSTTPTGSKNVAAMICMPVLSIVS